MKHLTTYFVLALALSAGAVITAPAEAQTRQARNAAREAYGRAQQLFADGQFEEAEAAFEEAYGHIPNPVVLVGVAESQERQGELAEAVATFQRYLAEREDAPDREAIEARIAALQQTPGTIQVSSVPAGASVLIDGQATGEVTPASFELPPGTVHIALALDGHVGAEADVTLSFGQQVEHQVTLEAEPEPEPAPVVPSEEPIELEDEAPSEEVEEDEGAGALVWATAGVAAAGLVAGTVLGFLALSEESDFDEMPNEASADRGERYALFADVAFGIAAAGAITAVVVFLTRDSGEEEEEETSSLQLTPVMGPNHGGMSARVEF